MNEHFHLWECERYGACDDENEAHLSCNPPQTRGSAPCLTYPIPPLTAPSTSTTRVTPQKRYLAMG